MQAFEEYVARLEAWAQAALQGDDDALYHVDFPAVLNGAVGAELRERVAPGKLQEKGAFFTGADLRRRALGPMLGDELSGCSAWDPACGAGDLLLSFAEVLPVKPDLEGTLGTWETRLHGFDIEPLFIRAARARLVLAAYNRGARRSGAVPMDLETALPQLRVRDALETEGTFPVVTHTALNPPFIRVPAPDDCEWIGGKVSAAALILERCLRQAEPGSRIVAILPDVLRSGSRYRAWRGVVERIAAVTRVEVYGAFDPSADVDVFVLELLVREQEAAPTDEDPRWEMIALAPHTLGDVCRVSTGSVVPHRDAESGDEYAYLHTSNATPWAALDRISERRRFSGTVVQPPVVVVRRTSSPSDRQRPVGTIILGNEPVAIENHLLILKPKRSGEDVCHDVLEVLRSPATREWLDQRIRTRHLTVGAVREIPWPVSA